jgi:uncharacterized protein with HEPN domain
MSEREWRFYLDDMIGFAENVLTYTEGFDQTKFESTGLNYDASLHNLSLIGEAATHIPNEIRESTPSHSLAAGYCDKKQIDTWIPGNR